LVASGLHRLVGGLVPARAHCCDTNNRRHLVAMSLTLESEQRMQKVSLIQFFTGSRAEWTRLAEGSYRFVRDEFPDDANVRPDDVAMALVPLLRVNERLVAYL